VIGRGLVTLLGVSIIIFVAIHLVPGSFVDIFVPVDAAAEVRTRLAHTYGLDQPLPIQYVRWVEATISGDLACRCVARPVLEELGQRLPPTAELTAIAMLLSLSIGVPLGIGAALAGRSPAGALARLVGAAALSVPSFVLASVLVYAFSGNRFGLSVGGDYRPLGVDVVANLRRLLYGTRSQRLHCRSDHAHNT